MVTTMKNGFLINHCRKLEVQGYRCRIISSNKLIGLIIAVLSVSMIACGPERPVSPPLPWTEATGINFALLSTETNAHMGFRMLSGTSQRYAFEDIVFYPVPSELKSPLIKGVAKWMNDKDKSPWIAVRRSHYWTEDSPQLLFWVEFSHKNELWIAARSEPGSNEGKFCRVWIVRDEGSNRVGHGLELCVSVREFPEVYNRLIRTYGKLENPRKLNLDSDAF